MAGGEGEIQAKAYWAHTGLRVAAGQRYRIEVVCPQDESDSDFVRDSWIPVRDLSGWPEEYARRPNFRALEWLRRRWQDPWFSLIATVDRKSPWRVVGTGSFEAKASGELVCYFNDLRLPWLYENNLGRVVIRLVEIR